MESTLIFNSTITCPKCHFQKAEVMATDACQYFYQCTNCNVLLKPATGDCCVFCSYGTMKCPPMQAGTSCCSNWRSMLIDEYLPVYHLKESHSIRLKSLIPNIYQQLLHCDFSKATLIQILFRLRGIPKGLYTIGHLTKIGFVVLKEEPGKEILFGMITNSPMFNTCRSDFSPGDFLLKSEESLIKTVINFHIEDCGNSEYVISTETRVWCSGKEIKSKFNYYWLFVKPFSQLIRKSMLVQIKKLIEKP